VGAGMTTYSEGTETEVKDDGDKGKAAPKPAKITKKDWQKVEAYLKEELEARKTSEFRKASEDKWTEIDRQIAMTPMVKFNRDGSEVDQGWHNVVELGELSKASENLSADVRRIIFPQTRFWFEGHAEIKAPLDQATGKPKKDPKLQEAVNGRLRSFMSQQHADFGLKDRVELSIKEALHHGGFVAEIESDTQEYVHEAVKISSKTAPVWKPHSMWNCYPDPSPSVVGTNLFYDGTMFVESFVPRPRAERMVKSGADGWMPSQWKKVPKETHQTKDGEKTKDVKLTTYWGDITIERSDGDDLYYPNHKVVLMNGTIIYMAPNKTPYPPLIYRGYERTDVRDPYYTSPIIKQSPMQKLGSTLANKYVDGVELRLEPPIVYDGNDPDFVLNGGPVIEPGAKVSTKGSNSFDTIEVGDPGIALQGLELILNEMKEKLGRPGRPVGDRATKAEVVKSAQDSEVSMVDFIDKMEKALLSFLYMQHAMNLTDLTEYSFYSPEVEDPDFVLLKKADLPKAVHFEVVGARGVLGEEERAQKFTTAAAFTLQNERLAPRLDIDEHLIQIYQDAGMKNPERFLVHQGEVNPGQVQAENAQLKQALQKVGGLLQEEKNKTAVKMAKIQSDAVAKDAKQKAEAADRQAKLQVEHADRVAKIQADFAAEMMKIKADMRSDTQELLANHALEQKRMFLEHMTRPQPAAGGEGEKRKPSKKTLKGRKVNGEWQLEVTEH
jgi:hypothetical protein